MFKELDDHVHRSRNTLRPYILCHCGLDPQTHTINGFDRMGCRIKSGRTQRVYGVWEKSPI